jgi:hypothetical protein
MDAQEVRVNLRSLEYDNRIEIGKLFDTKMKWNGKKGKEQIHGR